MERGRRVQYFAAFALSLATATMGVISAWPTPVLPKLHNNETSFNITDNEIATMLAMSSPGFVLGSLATRFVSDMFGRRATVLTSAAPFGTGMLIAATASQAWLLCVMKLLWGFGTGMVATVISIYLAEISDKDLRGKLSVGTRFMFNFGSLLMISIGPFLSYDILNYSISVLPLIFFVACLCIPESPYFYLKEGKVEQARRALSRLKEKENVDTELEMMRQDVSKEMKNSSSTVELFTGKQYRRSIIIAAGLKITQIMTGAVTIQQYLGRIMQEIDSDMKLSTLLIIFGAVKFLVGIMSSCLADRVGRRPLLIYSFLGTGVSLAIAGSYFFLQEVVRIDHSSLRTFGYIPFVAIIFSNVISTVGFNSIIGIIPAEIFPLNVKAVAMTSLNVFGGFLGFSVAKSYQAIKNISGLWGVFLIFALVAISGAIFSYFIVPETRGKSLREIQDILNTGVNDVPEGESGVECTELKQLREENDINHKC
ncbi:facilitated trehalose transporter Tret1-like [Vanessa atalanta]|uniref:facilitated trehalose transporter Tret1-like n=1 Tax=Vanessa atalanta TaxID=42275 RepID=UPI001FCD17BD|nr:facilitated trehalose transporter Tret1-like [Vanessa atalanta]XP_047529782.1 facilitated trehalose transporter Tret1-like [Vanessa atalanta]